MSGVAPVLLLHGIWDTGAVALHRFMIEDPRALSAVAAILAAPQDPP